MKTDWYLPFLCWLSHHLDRKIFHHPQLLGNHTMQWQWHHEPPPPEKKIYLCPKAPVLTIGWRRNFLKCTKIQFWSIKCMVFRRFNFYIKFTFSHGPKGTQTDQKGPKRTPKNPSTDYKGPLTTHIPFVCQNFDRISENLNEILNLLKWMKKIKLA